MLILATSLPRASMEDGQIVLSFASGKKQTVEIALTVNQALFAHQSLLNVALEQMHRNRYEAENPSDAEIVPFKRGKRRARS